MNDRRSILIDFIDSFGDGSLNEALHAGFDVIFEGTTSSGDMYSDGVRNSSINTTNADDGTEYMGGESETFGAPEHDLVDDLDLFDIETVTIHGDDESLKTKFHSTDTYKTIIPQIKGFADSHKLMQSHMNRSDSGVKILKA